VSVGLATGAPALPLVILLASVVVVDERLAIAEANEREFVVVIGTGAFVGGTAGVLAEVTNRGLGLGGAEVGVGVLGT
jgi:hypothetical protein